MSNENLNRIFEIGKQWHTNIYKVSEKDKKLLRDYYFEVTKKNLGGCASCYGKMYDYLINQNKTNMENKTKKVSNFEIKEGKLPFWKHKHYSNATITDEIAIEILKANPKNLGWFSRVPSDWRQLCGLPEEIIEEENEEVVETENQLEARKSLKGKKLIELQEVATNMELPEDEWINMKAGKLTDYIVANTK